MRRLEAARNAYPDLVWVEEFEAPIPGVGWTPWPTAPLIIRLAIPRNRLLAHPAIPDLRIAFDFQGERRSHGPRATGDRTSPLDMSDILLA